MDNKVSIIIPVYNTESYLDRCLESIVVQSEKNFEVILIDDGSTDNCSKICDEWALKDNRIHVIHQKNSGVSFSRNKGIEYSSNEWIMFVDSDDWLDENAIKTLLSNVKNEDDLIIGTIVNDYSITQNTVNQFNGQLFLYDMNQYRTDFQGGCVIEPCVFKNHFKKKMKNLPFLGSPCGKIYKKDLIQKNNIRFNEKITYGEDSFFNLEFLAYAENVKYIESPIYHYIMHPNSLSTGRVDQKYKQYNDYVDKIDELIKVYSIKDFDNFLAMDLTQMTWELSEMYGMDVHSITQFLVYRMLLKKFAHRDECKSAINKVKVNDLPDFKHKVIVIFLKMRMYGITILGCNIFYTLFSNKNRIRKV